MMSHPNKKLINSPNTCVEDMLCGLKATYPGLSINISAKIVMRCQSTKNNCVGIVSGGGSGHEPFCAGFVGKGMLNAAICGSVFTSPPARNCLRAIQNVAERNTGGVVVLIPNYTGDILSFGEAIEIARDQGYKVESIIVGEDCALLSNTDDDDDEMRIVGKRGLCGQLFMYKIAGALAYRGHNVSTIMETCNKVLSNMASLGVCTSPCTLPGANRPLFYLAPEHIELGLGVHGEAGITKINMCSASEVVEIILRKILLTLSLNTGDEVCVIINNLGASSQMESYIIAGEVSKQLGNCGITVRRMYVGSMLTSLDMGGIQVCLLNTTNKSDWLKLLDDETEAFAWPGRISSCEQSLIENFENADCSKKLIGPELDSHESQLFRNCLHAAACGLQSAEERLNLLDSGCGDGDCGTTLRHLADAILESLNNLPVHRPTSCFLELAEIASEKMGGTSGGIYSLLLRGAARMAPDWTLAFREAVETVKKYSPAREGCRTMMDALIPACNEYEQCVNTKGWQVALSAAVRKAEIGCEATRNMEAKCGRASYVNKSYLNDVDAGAFAVTIWLQAVYKELCENY